MLKKTRFYYKLLNFLSITYREGNRGVEAFIITRLEGLCLTEFRVDQLPGHPRAIRASKRWPYCSLGKTHSKVVVKTGPVHWVGTLVRSKNKCYKSSKTFSTNFYLKRSNLGQVATGFLQSACWFFKYSVIIPSRVRLGGSRVLSGTNSLTSTFSNDETGSFL